MSHTTHERGTDWDSIRLNWDEVEARRRRFWELEREKNDIKRNFYLRALRKYGRERVRAIVKRMRATP